MHLLRAGELLRSHIQVILLHWPWLVNKPLALLACATTLKGCMSCCERCRLQATCRMMPSWVPGSERWGALKPYQQKTRGCLCGAGAGMSPAGKGCMAFPVKAFGCHIQHLHMQYSSRTCAGLYWTTSNVNYPLLSPLHSRLMQPHRGPSAGAQGCFNPAWLHDASFWEARPCCDSLQRYTQSALYN